MAIVRMKKLKLLAVRTQREEILRDLMLLGCVEVTEPDPESEPELLEKLSRAGGTEIAGLRSDYASLMNAIRLLDRYAPEKKSLLSSMPEVSLDKLLDEGSLRADLKLAGLIYDKDDEIRCMAAQESLERSLIESLIPWKDLDMPLNFKGTESCAALLVTVPAAASLDEMDSVLRAESERAVLYRVSSDKTQHCLVLICMHTEKENILNALRPYGFTVITFGDVKGTAGETIAELRTRLNELASVREKRSAEIIALASHREDLKLRADTLHNKIARAEAASQLMYTDSTFLIEGWIPEPDESKLAKAAEKFDCAWETSEPDPESAEEVPIKLRSNAATRPFTMVTSMYSYPAYNGVDPNPFLFVSFAMFFGIMFADVGYGLVMVALGLFMKYKMKAKGGMAWFSGLAIVCGASAAVFGAVTGTFFGDIIGQVSAFFGGSASFSGPIDPIKEPMKVLVISLVIGIVHMFVGVGIKGYMLIRDGHWFDALCDAGTVYLVFIGVGLGALGITWWVAIAGLLAVVATQGRESKSIGGKIGGGLYGLYNFATGWFGDILSYSRLMALMLAGTVIAQVFNTLGAMTGNIVFFFLIFLVGHALNFGLSIISAYVHSSRLEYLEFFSKFYREGGREFSPLAIKTNYYVCNQ
jgi:V/A-type H+-transporting ATPase subunit I